MSPLGDKVGIAMLKFLHIENIAVIKRLDLEFDSGFTVLTGETGAGKSIIIDSIGLLMGARSSKELIRSGESFAKVKAVFSDIGRVAEKELSTLDIFPDEDGNISIARTIFADGKAQAKINGEAVLNSELREAAKHLINIHSQNESYVLSDSTNHIKYLDSYAKVQDSEELKQYKEAYGLNRQIKKKLDEIKDSGRKKENLREILEYRIHDIESAKLSPGEDTKLEEECLLLRNAEKLTKGTNFVYRALASNPGGLCACDLLEKSEAALKKLGEFVPEANKLAERLESCRYEIRDIGETVTDFVPDLDGDVTRRLDAVEERLDLISKLKRKYGASVDEIIETLEKSKVELDELENSNVLTEKYEKEYAESSKRLISAAKKLNELRKAAAEVLGKRITEELDFLDMHGARVQILAQLQSDVTKYSENGGDSVEFLMSANPGEKLKPMSKTASGGEMSRIMLAIKSELAGKSDVDTVIFDEIDTGVSGKTSEKIGLRLKKIAKNSQTLSITHSAQIASLADCHMFISKSENQGRNETSVKVLDIEERILETARINSGVSISEKQLEAAREMVLAGSKAEV